MGFAATPCSVNQNQEGRVLLQGVRTGSRGGSRAVLLPDPARLQLLFLPGQPGIRKAKRGPHGF